MNISGSIYSMIIGKTWNSKLQSIRPINISRNGIKIHRPGQIPGNRSRSSSNISYNC